MSKGTSWAGKGFVSPERITVPSLVVTVTEKFEIWVGFCCKLLRVRTGAVERGVAAVCPSVDFSAGLDSTGAGISFATAVEFEGATDFLSAPSTLGAVFETDTSFSACSTVGAGLVAFSVSLTSVAEDTFSDSTTADWSLLFSDFTSVVELVSTRLLRLLFSSACTVGVPSATPYIAKLAIAIETSPTFFFLRENFSCLPL